MLDFTNLTLADAAAAPPPPSPAPSAQTGTQTGQTAAQSAAGNGQANTKQPGGSTPSSKPVPTPNGGPLGGLTFPLILLIAVGVMWFFMTSSQRKQKKQRAQLLASLSKGDKVQTVGGIIGTVADIRGDEIIVKVDENANTRLRFARNAIQSVVDDKSEA